VASGLSSAVQAGVFDYVQGDFMANAGGVDNFLEKEVERFRNHARTMGGQSGNPMRRWAVNLYLLYLSTQEKLSSRGNYDRKVNDAGSSERRLIRLWSFLGPTTNRTILIVCGLLGTIRLYLWTTTILGNLWLVFCLLLQSRSLQSTKRPAS
jgi:hypothetical protein